MGLASAYGFPERALELLVEPRMSDKDLDLDRLGVEAELVQTALAGASPRRKTGQVKDLVVVMLGCVTELSFDPSMYRDPESKL